MRNERDHWRRQAEDTEFRLHALQLDLDDMRNKLQQMHVAPPNDQPQAARAEANSNDADNERRRNAGNARAREGGDNPPQQGGDPPDFPRHQATPPAFQIPINGYQPNQPATDPVGTFPMQQQQRAPHFGMLQQGYSRVTMSKRS